MAKKPHGLRLKQASAGVGRRIGRRRKVLASPRKRRPSRRHVKKPVLPVAQPVTDVGTPSVDPASETRTADTEVAISLPQDAAKPAMPKPALRSILKRPQAPLTPAQRGAKRVHFKNVLAIHEYARVVGGSSCVPQDGSTLALGLGELVRVVSEPESPNRRKIRNCGDGLNFLPVVQRERMLRASNAALGKGNTAAGPTSKAFWKAHREELRDVQRSRATEIENATNWQPMTDSLQKANLRAQNLASSLQKAREKATASTKAAAVPGKSRSRGRARRKAAKTRRVAQAKSGSAAAPVQGHGAKPTAKRSRRARRKKSV